MDTGAHMATATDILTLHQWFSPAYPVGAFAYSHGLEAAIDTGQVRNASDAKAWITQVIAHGSGWCDCLFLVAAYHAENAEALDEIDAMVRAFSPSRERLQETDLQGAAFCDATAALWPQPLTGLTYPVAVGKAAKTQDLPLELTTQMYLQAFMANLTAAATRCIPLGQTEGQKLTRDLTPLCVEIASAAQSADLDQLSSTTFLCDIASMHHETQYSRMFRT